MHFFFEFHDWFLLKCFYIILKVYNAYGNVKVLLKRERERETDRQTDRQTDKGRGVE